MINKKIHQLQHKTSLNFQYYISKIKNYNMWNTNTVLFIFQNTQHEQTWKNGSNNISKLSSTQQISYLKLFLEIIVAKKKKIINTEENKTQDTE